MTTQNVHEELQFDYFSQNYYQFQEDFYQFSNLPQPLMVMEDDILLHMVSRPDQAKRLCIYHYQGQTEDIN